MAGYYQYCNCCGHAYSGASGARAYLDHLGKLTYYAARVSPEATYCLGAKAREFLGGVTFREWVLAHYAPDWRCRSDHLIDVIPAAYAWLSFAGEPKAPEYQAWRVSAGLA